MNKINADQNDNGGNPGPDVPGNPDVPDMPGVEIPQVDEPKIPGQDPARAQIKA